MKRTSIRSLAGLAVAWAFLGWAYANWIVGHGRLPAVPWLAALVVWVLTGFVAAWSVSAHRRLHSATNRLPPLIAARTAALSLAGSRTGAIILGGYAGVALRILGEQGIAAARVRVLAATVAALGGLLLATLSLWLEHKCRLPEQPGRD